MRPTLLSAPHDRRELALQSVNGGAQTLGIVVATVELASLKLANRCLQFREGCAPFPLHKSSIPNICLEFNTLTRQNLKTCLKSTQARPELPFPSPSRSLAVFPEREGDAGHVRLKLDCQNPRILLIAPAVEDRREVAAARTVVGDVPVARVQPFDVETLHRVNAIERLPLHPPRALAIV